MAHQISCEVPLWVERVWYWYEDKLVTGSMFDAVMNYLIKIEIAVCEIVEHTSL